MTRSIKLPPRTNFYFQRFLSDANKSILHPLDWQRFDHFIWAAHVGRTKLYEYELSVLLYQNGFSKDYAEKIASVYEHGRSLLGNRVNLRYLDNDKWKT